MGYLWVILLCFLTDRITKLLIAHKLNGEIAILPFLNITKVYNKGFLFGLGSTSDFFLKKILYIFLPILLVIFFSFLLYRLKDRFQKYIVALIIGGALGNLFDRIFYGKVLDFIDFHIGNWHYPAFNIADICISLGIFLFFISLIFPHLLTRN